MKTNMSEIIKKMAKEQNDIDIEELRQVMADFTNIVLKELKIGNEVAIPRLGVLFSKRSRKARRDGICNNQIKLRSSLTG